MMCHSYCNSTFFKSLFKLKLQSITSDKFELLLYYCHMKMVITQFSFNLQSITLDAFKFPSHKYHMKILISFLFKEDPEQITNILNNVIHRPCIKWSLMACQNC